MDSRYTRWLALFVFALLIVGWVAAALHLANASAGTTGLSTNLNSRLTANYGSDGAGRFSSLRLSIVTDFLRDLGFNIEEESVTGDMDGGAAFALVSYHEGSDTGLNASFINLTNEVPKGVNFGFVNVAQGHTMIDFGGYNGSKSSDVQIGFINFTDQIDGVQIGFLNFAKNGFFPFFPFVNFPKN